MKQETEFTKHEERLNHIFTFIIGENDIVPEEMDYAEHLKIHKIIADIKNGRWMTFPKEWAAEVPAHMWITVLKYFCLLYPADQYLIAQTIVYEEEDGSSDLLANFIQCYEKFIEGDLITKELNGPELIALLQDSKLLENIMIEPLISMLFRAKYNKEFNEEMLRYFSDSSED
jgi:hypothetical protein